MTDQEMIAANAETRKTALELLEAMRDDPYPHDPELMAELQLMADGKLYPKKSKGGK